MMVWINLTVDVCIYVHVMLGKGLKASRSFYSLNRRKKRRKSTIYLSIYLKMKKLNFLIKQRDLKLSYCLPTNREERRREINR